MSILPPSPFLYSDAPAVIAPDEAATALRQESVAVDIQSSCGGQWPTDVAPSLGPTLHPPSSPAASGHGIDPTGPQEAINHIGEIFVGARKWIDDDQDITLSELCRRGFDVRAFMFAIDQMPLFLQRTFADPISAHQAYAATLIAFHDEFERFS